MEPFAVSPQDAGPLYGRSRAGVYEDLKKGKIRAVKHGSSTLVVVESIKELLASLPPAYPNPADKAS